LCPWYIKWYEKYRKQWNLLEMENIISFEKYDNIRISKNGKLEETQK
jgi:hypothetical protein